MDPSPDRPWTRGFHLFRGETFRNSGPSLSVFNTSTYPFGEDRYHPLGLFGSFRRDLRHPRVAICRRDPGLVFLLLPGEVGVGTGQRVGEPR